MLSNLAAHGKTSYQLIRNAALNEPHSFEFSTHDVSGSKKVEAHRPANYSHRNERFSATIRPFAIRTHRHAITRPSSK